MPPSTAGRPSSLPQQIPPQTAEFGKAIDENGKILGKVIIDINYWLFLFNISKQVLSAAGTPVPVTPSASSFTISDDDIVPPNPAPQTIIDWMGPV